MASPYYLGTGGGNGSGVGAAGRGGEKGLTGSLSSGLKILARTSSRRAGAGSDGGSGKSNISGPLQLLPEQDQYQSPYQERLSSRSGGNSNAGGSPYGDGGQGGRYAQSLSNVSIMSHSSVMSSATVATTMSMKGPGEKPVGSSARRWSSMKMILGLKVGSSKQ